MQSQPTSHPISLVKILLIFTLAFIIIVGLILAATYYIIYPFVTKVRSTAQTINYPTQSPSATIDPYIEKEAKFSESYQTTKSLYNQHKYKEATPSAQRMLDLAQSDAEKNNAYGWLGAIYYNLNQYKQAEDYLNQAVALNNEDLDSYSYLFSIYYYRKDYKKALSITDTALEINQNSSLFHNQRGITLDSLGRYNEALKEYQKAIELDPDNKVARDNLKNLQEYLNSNK